MAFNFVVTEQVLDGSGKEKLFFLTGRIPGRSGLGEGQPSAVGITNDYVLKIFVFCLIEVLGRKFIT